MVGENVLNILFTQVGTSCSIYELSYNDILKCVCLSKECKEIINSHKKDIKKLYLYSDLQKNEDKKDEYVMCKIIRRYIQKSEEINELIELLFSFDEINVIHDYMDSFVSNISEELLWISKKKHISSYVLFIEFFILYMEDYYIKKKKIPNTIEKTFKKYNIDSESLLEYIDYCKSKQEMLDKRLMFLNRIEE